ncbi:MAG: SRPBCC domain-containing protein [Candidatus Latescibacteria bacterium]|jgi:uncharacterized protein YndB with AHSA1/START domain|nr:SRPBCC domain-containing protein [Candidatus Latescibacterota bacterium]
MPLFPDLSSRPHKLRVKQTMTTSPPKIYLAWTEQFDTWFAAPGSLLMRPYVDAPFFFESRFEGQRHPHYGRFLKLQNDRLVVMTWITGDPGTLGAETIVSVALTPKDGGTYLTLDHQGFADKKSRDAHKESWPLALARLDECLSDNK